MTSRRHRARAAEVHQGDESSQPGHEEGQRGRGALMGGSYDTLLFRCAICERDIRDYPDRDGRQRHLEPVCRMCVSTWTQGTGSPRDGAMMDRRKARHILALSNALHNAAAVAQWSTTHGRA